MGWVVLDERIVYENGNENFFPTAEDIFYAAMGGEKPINYKIPDDALPLKSALPELQFSKLPAKVYAEYELKDKKIQLSVYAEKSGKKKKLTILDKIAPDYIIIDNKWSFLSGDYFLFREYLEKSAITDLTNITFVQYVTSLNIQKNYPLLKINNNIKDSLSELFSDIPEGSFSNLNATLYPYQQTGFNWLRYITKDGGGCILGDEMGLGKTIQVIALMAQRKTIKNNPFLVIAPLSLLENWKREISKFAPLLSVLVHHGSKRTGRYRDFLMYDVIITSYGSVVSDLSIFSMIKWDLLILDEAQNIKNPEATRTKCIKDVPHRASIAVTGTPFENHMLDIWSLLDFSLPGCLGDKETFVKEYKDDIQGAKRIEPILTALMIRRKVKDVANDLPERIIISQPIKMNEEEANQYETERCEILKRFDGKSASLAMLTKLRMFCTHPFLLRNEYDLCHNLDPIIISTKYQRLCEILEEIIESNEKAILFTSYTAMFHILEVDINRRFGIPVYSINGATQADIRQNIVDEFSNLNGPALLVLNPRAAGVGLNITSANHVIHYNLEWNPALEDQATARSYRRGQNRNVFIYRLFYADTVEEIVNEKIDNKRDIADIAVVGSIGTEDTREMIIKALNISPLKKL